MFEYATSAESRGIEVIIAAAGGAAHLPGMVASVTTLPVIVVSAGNNSGSGAGIQSARYNSPMANAAVRGLAANIVVVEGIMQLLPDPAPQRFPASDEGGHVSAGAHSVRVALRVDYGLKDGTSMAAPFVAGLVGYLYAADPSLPRPTLASNPVRDILIETAVPVSGVAPHVDAYAALLTLESRTGTDIVLSSPGSKVSVKIILNSEF